MLPNVLTNIIAEYAATDPNIVPSVEKNLDKIDWSQLSRNINAVAILEQDLDKTDLAKIDWSMLTPKTYKENIRDIAKQINESFAKNNINPIS
jgi:hypothetical protein